MSAKNGKPVTSTEDDIFTFRSWRRNDEDLETNEAKVMKKVASQPLNSGKKIEARVD